ncbi:hypothetical protein [Silanimonas sp.]|uniref:hypothetical protein n=1 Tax=Silanimonas sp. TaxID=1929290 RepID=UPI001BC058D8|nr:hypothetical protein [Silanimonas sp.]MBS3896217.1 hypothetical protein [Silanimonas sp.]MBS3924809.1 hypothetical protein [Xanthomonadaceae bacterium]
MLRTVFAFLLGSVTMVASVALLQMLGHWIWPQSAIDAGDRAAFAAQMASVPLAAKLWVLVAYATAVEVGTIIAVLVQRRRWRGLAMALGLLMTALCALNFAMLPHPWWMVVVGLLLPLPVAMMAGWWLRPRPSAA